MKYVRPGSDATAEGSVMYAISYKIVHTSVTVGTGEGDELIRSRRE